jgi:hypothetical protein
MFKPPFQTEPIKPNKWYVSLGPSITRRTKHATIEPTRGSILDTRILVPFDTECEAEETSKKFEEQNPNYKGRTSVWQASESMCSH